MQALTTRVMLQVKEGQKGAYSFVNYLAMVRSAWRAEKGTCENRGTGIRPYGTGFSDDPADPTDESVGYLQLSLVDWFHFMGAASVSVSLMKSASVSRTARGVAAFRPGSQVYRVKIQSSPGVRSRI